MNNAATKPAVPALTRRTLAASIASEAYGAAGRGSIVYTVPSDKPELAHVARTKLAWRDGVLVETYVGIGVAYLAADAFAA